MRQEDIQILIDRYLDGETSNQEEQLLRDYFCGADTVPGEWRVYKALFAYEAGERQAAVPAQADAGRPARPLVRRLAVALAVAACLGGAVMLVLHQPAEQPRNYAVVDGELITSQQRVEQEAEEALALVSADMEDDFDALNLL